jgi:hypothetical protein
MASLVQVKQQLQRARAKVREERQASKIQDLGVQLGGNAAAAAAAWGVGFLETRFPGPGGQPGQIGPIPYPVAGSLLANVAASVAVMMDAPVVGGVTSHVAAGMAGMAAGAYGRAHGVKARAKATAPKKVGASFLSEADRALLDD